MNAGDREYLETLLKLLPWCLNNVTADVTPFQSGETGKARECGPNAVQRVLEDRTLGLAYGWLVGRKRDRWVSVGHLLNTGVNHENILKTGRFTDPTPMPADLQLVGFVPDPQPFEVFNERKRRLDELEEDVLHDLLEEVLRDHVEFVD